MGGEKDADIRRNPDGSLDMVGDDGQIVRSWVSSDDLIQELIGAELSEVDAILDDRLGDVLSIPSPAERSDAARVWVPATTWKELPCPRRRCAGSVEIQVISESYDDGEHRFDGVIAATPWGGCETCGLRESDRRVRAMARSMVNMFRGDG